jgi:UDP-glucose 4-epimerase
MKVLVTGAAGYIGSVLVETLIESGHAVVALDNLKYGHRAAVHPDAEFILADLADDASLDRAFEGRFIEAVVHLAAESKVEESMRDPGLFYGANICAGLNLLRAMLGAGVRDIVFSSSAAVYGEPAEIPIQESAAIQPVNAYGETKAAFERALGWFGAIHGIRHVSLRYFNACGASERYGEARAKPTHIIPLLLEAAAGEREAFTLFGTDYPTRDGTCVRDYVHVSDIAQAHVLALAKMDHVAGRAYNVGSGNGYTNREVAASVERVTGRSFPTVDGPRRPGDPAQLVASSRRIEMELGWEPRFSDIDSMTGSAWHWKLAHPKGYTD